MLLISGAEKVGCGKIEDEEGVSATVAKVALRKAALPTRVARESNVREQFGTRTFRDIEVSIVEED